MAIATKKREGKKARDEFKEIRKKVRMEDVLDYYGLLNGLKREEGKLVSCPLCKENHDGKNFRINTAENTWHCFSCGESGDVLDFVVAMEDVNVELAVYLVKKWLGIICDEDREMVKEMRLKGLSGR